MRLQLTLLLCLHAVAAAQPADEPAATASLHVYADDDHVTVVSPSASVRADVTPRVSISADSTVDAVSAASVDVVTSASPRTVHEQRVELGLASTVRYKRVSWWTLAARGSHEHDYDALRVRATGRVELAQRNTMLQLDYVAGYDIITSMMDASFERHRTSHELMTTGSQLVSRRAVVDIIVDVTRADGYHASPYRRVPVDMPGMPLPSQLEEVTPRLRSSAALALRLRYAVTDRVTASGTYRWYDDTWSVMSHTMTAEVYRSVHDWLIGATLRGYSQSEASFYSPHYAGEPRYRTRDRTLGAMRSLYGAATCDVPFDDWHMIASAGLMHLRFFDFVPQSDRNAVMVFTSMTRTW